MRVRALIVEDRPDDAELVALEIEQSGHDVTWRRVGNLEDFRRALDEEPWDVVVSDYSLPRMTALEPLAEVRARHLDLPFIIVSGSVGEEVAVGAMKAGAHDFFSKSNLARLGSAIERELKEAEVRRERRRAVEELRHAEETYRLILDGVKDHAIFMLAADGRIASWSRGAERVTGYPADEAIGRPYALLFCHEELVRGQDRADLARAAEEALHGEGWRARKDGSRFWAEWSLDAIRLGETLRGYSALVRDISERQRLVEDLRRAVTARDEFLSIASHELKTPLTSLELQLEGMRRLCKGGHAVPATLLAPRLEVLLRQSHRLTALINTLLDVTRITGGRLVVVREEVDLGHVVRRVTDRLRDEIDRARTRVIVDAPSGIVGRWDRFRLETLVTNLLSNAIKYGEHRPVRVTVRASGGSATLTVVDHGIGISRDALSRIFTRFERAVPEEHYGGLGIGLWIARQVVSAHGGRIRVTSRPGGGSTFVVDLPLEERSAAEAPTPT